MPSWFQQIISFLESHESVLSSISSFMAILAATVGTLGFILGWWRQLWHKLRQRSSLLTATNQESAKTEVTGQLSATLQSVGTTVDPVVMDGPKLQQDLQTLRGLNYNHPRKITQELEVYLERLEADVLEGFRADQYIDLTVEALESEDGSTLRAVQQALRSTFEINAQAWPAGGDTLPVEEALHDHRLVVLLGDPGGGKTTSLRYITLKQIQLFRTSGSGLIPVWISLGNWSDKNMSVIEFLWREYTRLADVADTNMDDFGKSLEKGKFFFLLDGLNELPQRDRPDTVHEDQFRESAKPVSMDKRENDLFVLARNTRSRFLLSCRLLDYAHQSGWHEFRVLPLSPAQIMKLANRQLDSEFQVFENILSRQPALQDVIRTPFLLRGLIRLIQEGSTLDPSDRFELVQFVCNSAIARESARLRLDSEYLANALGRVSWQLMDQGSIGSFFMPPSDHALTLELPNGAKFKVIDAINWGKSAGLFVPSGYDLDQTPKYRFLHQLIQEALALIYLQAALDENENIQRASALLEVGRTHAEWGLLKEAEDNLLRALDLCPISVSPATRARILLSLSDVYREWRRSVDALPLSEQAVQILESQEPTKLLGRSFYNLALTYGSLRKVSEAEKYFIKAIALYEKLGNKSDAAYSSVLGLGDLYAAPSQLYNAEKAFLIFQRALAVFQEEKDELGIARTHLQMAHLHRFEANVAASLDLFSKCERRFQELESPWLRLNALEYGAILLRDARRLADASIWADRAQSLAEELGALAYQVSILIYARAWVASLQGKHLESLEWSKQAHQIALRLSSPANLLDSYSAGFGTTYWRAKDFSEAAKYFRLYESAMDYEERIYITFLYSAAIVWADRLGRHVSTNFVARILTEICWQIARILEVTAVPTSWSGRKLYRFQWWLQRFRWMRN